MIYLAIYTARHTNPMTVPESCHYNLFAVVLHDEKAVDTVEEWTNASGREFADGIVANLRADGAYVQMFEYADLAYIPNNAQYMLRCEEKEANEA